MSETLKIVKMIGSYYIIYTNHFDRPGIKATIWGITKSCDHLRPAIILTPPPTITHDQPFFTATTDNDPRPTIIKSPLSTNKDSRNYPRNNKFWIIFLPPLFTQQNSKSSLNLFATTHQILRNFLFRKAGTVFHS